MKEKKTRGPKVKPDGYEYKHKRAVSLTDSEFQKAKKYYTGLSQAVIAAIEMAERTTITKE